MSVLHPYTPLPCSIADVVMLAPIYAARETNTTGISSDDVADLIPGAFSCGSFGEIAERLEEYGKDSGMEIHIQREEIFDAMHRI